MRIKLTDSAEIAGQKYAAGAELTVPPDAGRYLVAKNKATEIPAEAEPAKPAPQPKSKTQTRRTRSKK